MASGQPPRVGRVLISAHTSHAAGARPRTIDTYQDAVATKADYVEFDIRRTADGELVAFHDAFCGPGAGHGQPLAALAYPRLCELAGCEVPRVADVLAVIKGRAKGHLDLKETGYEYRLVRLALDVLGPGGFVVTSLEDASVAAIRSRFPDAAEVPVALSLGRGMKGAPRSRWLRTRVSELWPASRLRACGADWAAVNRRLALAGDRGAVPAAAPHGHGLDRQRRARDPLLAPPADRRARHRPPRPRHRTARPRGRPGGDQGGEQGRDQGISPAGTR